MYLLVSFLFTRVQQNISSVGVGTTDHVMFTLIYRVPVLLPSNENHSIFVKRIKKQTKEHQLGQYKSKGLFSFITHTRILNMVYSNI